MTVAAAAMSLSLRMLGSPSGVCQWKGPRAHLLGAAAEGIPVLEARPHVFARLLRVSPQGGHVYAGNHPIPHAHHSVDDHGLHVVPDAALHEALDGIAHRPVAERAVAGEVDDHDVGLGPRGEAAEVVAPEGPCAAQGGGG